MGAGEIDGAVALSLVVWPPKGSRLEDEPVPRGRQLLLLGAQGRDSRRHAEGETIPALAESTGIPFASIKHIIQFEKREQARAGFAATKDPRAAGI